MHSERSVFWGLVALTVAAPLLIAGTHPITQVCLSIGALLLTAYYVLVVRRSKGLRPVAMVLPMAIAIGFTMLQLIPLPLDLIERLSPHAAELRQEVMGGPSGWAPITLDVSATLLELVKGFAYLGLMIVVAGYVKSAHRGRSILLCIALLGGAMAVVSAAQRIFGTSAILGVYHPRSQTGSISFGTFVNSNHAASLFTLAALCGAGLTVELKDDQKRFLTAAASTLSVVALLWTGSRAGAMGLAVGTFLLLGLGLSRRTTAASAWLGATLVVAILAVGAFWTANGLRNRITTGEGLFDNQKTRGWQDSVTLVRDYPLVGVGRGAIEAPLSKYRHKDEGVRLVFPENLLLQLSTEWGLPVTLLLLLLVMKVGNDSLQGIRKVEMGAVGAACGVTAVAVHELGDFGLEMPGVAIPTVVALGVFLGRTYREHSGAKRVRLKPPVVVSLGVLAIWALVIAGGAWAAPRTLLADAESARKMVANGNSGASHFIDAAIERHPASAYLELLAAKEALRTRAPSVMHHLTRALRLHPADWQAHRLAARALSANHHVAQAALEYRLALESGMPLSYDELTVVAGQHVVDAVPQTSKQLMSLASHLSSTKRVSAADAACDRAIELSANDRRTLTLCTQLAMDGKSGPETLKRRAAALLDGSPSVDAVSLAAQVLERAAEPGRADQAILAGISAHPGDGTLVLAGAKLRMGRGELAAAKMMVAGASTEKYTLADRQAAEELLAQIADKMGNPEEAVVARARARLLSRARENKINAALGVVQ
jgi:hypothetical protein